MAMGKVIDSNGVTILEVEAPTGGRNPQSSSGARATHRVGGCEAARRLFYFSTVTFTTLGYGDYHPDGVLQVVASTEVLLGALVIALVTIVFARKFLRR